MKVSRGASQSLTQAQQNKDASKLSNDKVSKKGADSAAKSSLASSAQVSLSKQAQQIKRATDLAKKDTVDEKKVAFFQNMIDGGKYQVDSAKVADALVDDHMKMPS